MAPAIALTALSVFSNILAGAVHTFNRIVSRNEEPDDHKWQKPDVEVDSRSPCPMLNALANHGYLPRDGKNISLLRLVTALQDSINLAPDATLFAGVIALQASTTGDRYSFHLGDLSTHGVIEHDGSLSRHDVNGPPHTNNTDFAHEVWVDVVANFEGGPTISIETAERARRQRLAIAPRLNPHFEMSDTDKRASVIETCLYLRVFGKETEGRARTDWVRVLFEQERLPFEEGFRRSDAVITISDILKLEEKVNGVGEIERGVQAGE